MALTAKEQADLNAIFTKMVAFFGARPELLQSSGFGDLLALIGGAPADGSITAAKLATGAVTPVKTAPLLRVLVTTGHSGAGAVTFAGAAVGDLVVDVVNLTDGTGDEGHTLFESTISVAGQIHQASATDLSAKKLVIVLQRQS